jgi:hypothetical protein
VPWWRTYKRKFAPRDVAWGYKGDLRIFPTAEDALGAYAPSSSRPHVGRRARKRNRAARASQS